MNEGNNSMTRIGRSILLFCILFSVTFTGIMPCDVFAEQNADQENEVSDKSSRTYDGDGYSIRYEVSDKWATGFTAEISMTNTSDRTVEDWRLRLPVVNGQVSLWNAQLESEKDGMAVIKNAGHNADIVPGSTVTFGFTGEEAFRGFPENITLISRNSELPDERFRASYRLLTDWKDGFSGEIEIEDRSDSTIEDWSLEFDFGRKITEIWNAQIVSHEGDHYVIKNAGYNSDIGSGKVVSFGFNGTGGSESDEPTGYKLTHYGDQGKKDEITIHFDPVVNGASDVPADICVSAGEYAAEPEEIPQCDDGIFIGWCKDKNGEELFDFDTEKPTYDMTLYADWYDVNDETDTDGDGLTDQAEELLLTDPDKADTDSDGIDDYTELNLTMTDPLLTDSDGDGTDDGDADADSDGLTNAVEMIRGTKPIDPDSDDDSLEDGEEVNTYRTDPLKADTDGDGAEDATEIRFGFDPLVRNDSFDATAEAEGKVTATARLTVNGEQLNTLSVKADDNPTLFPDDMPGYIGEAYDFHVDGTFDKATVSFEFDKSLLADPQFDPVIYYFNEDEQELEELDTVVLGNTASTTVTHFSTYILLNRKKFNDTINSFLTDIWEAGDYKSVETVFVIDDSGSMTYNDSEYDRLQVAKELVDGLPESEKSGVVSFSNSTHIYTDKLTSDKNEVKRYLDRKFFSSYGGTYMYSAIDSAMNLFSDDSDDTLRLEIILTDGDAFDTGMHSSVIQKAKQKNVKLYTVGLGSSESYFTRYLEPLAEETGGEFYVAAKAAGLKSVYDSIGKSIDLSVDSDGDGIPDYYEDNLVAFNGKRIITDKNNPDTDGDGLTDGEEVEIRVKQYGKKAIVFGRYHSNPRSGDSDGDGLYDGEPRYINKNGRTIKAAPKDMEPLKMNGHRRFWDAHVKSQQERIITDYSASPTEGEVQDEINRDIERLLKTTNDKKKQDKIKKAWKMMGDSVAGLFNSKGGNGYSKKKTRNVVKNSINLGRRYLSAQTMADVGAYILCFKMDVDNKAYHSSDKNWQKYFGYNSLYDMVFDAATDMNTQRVTFSSGGESYAVWMWKGDYLNLNSGAEIGLYSSPIGSGDKVHYAKVKAVDMNLSLYKYDTYSIQTIVNWYPDDPQWWITGFSGARKEFRHPRANRLFVIGHVKLGSIKGGFMKSLKKTTLNSGVDKFIVEDDDDSIWVYWDEFK